MKSLMFLLAVSFAIAQGPATGYRDGNGKVFGYVEKHIVRDKDRRIVGYIQGGKTYDRNRKIICSNGELPGLLFRVD